MPYCMLPSHVVNNNKNDVASLFVLVVRHARRFVEGWLYGLDLAKSY